MKKTKLIWYYLKHPSLLLAYIDLKYFKRWLARNGFPKNKQCPICNKHMHSYALHGGPSDLTIKHRVAGMGVRLGDCPFCGSTDKHRWLLYVLENKTGIRTEKCDVLHFAPESIIRERITRNKKCNYLSGDIEAGRADCVVDMTNMEFKDQSFDYIIASMVLEHIEKENKAIKELIRCVKPSGKIILTVPIDTQLSHTLELNGIKSDHERFRLYGQVDHVRLYGLDTEKRLGAYGLDVVSYKPGDVLKKKEIVKRGLDSEFPVFVCTLSQSPLAEI